MGLEGCTCLFHERNMACIICWNIPGVSHKHIVSVPEAECVRCEILSVLQIEHKGMSTKCMTIVFCIIYSGWCLLNISQLQLVF